jgi:hypothetical protein
VNTNPRYGVSFILYSYFDLAMVVGEVQHGGVGED